MILCYEQQVNNVNQLNVAHLGRKPGVEINKDDELIPLKYNIIGQETTGPGGMMKALRTITPMLEIAKCIEKNDL